MPIHLLQGNTRENQRLLQLLHGWGIGVHASTDVAAFIAEAYRCSVDADAPEALLIDSRGRPENPFELLDLLRNSSRLGALRYILITDEQIQAGNPGYDAVLHSPLDKTLLFSALHAQPQRAQHAGVTPLLDHYLRTRSTLPPLEILVAIRNQVQLKMVRRQLARQGHHVYTASSGELALDAMTAHHFDVAILDVSLDDMDGMEVAHLYRMTHPKPLASPIVMLASEPSIELQQRCEDAGAAALLGLPLQLQRLDDTLRLLLTQDGTLHASLQAETSGSAPAVHLDRHTLRELEALGEGLGFIRELVDRFISDSNELLHAMRAAVDAQDLESFRDFATALKGSSGSVGGVHLQRFCIRLAGIGRADYRSNAERLLGLLHEHLQATQSALLSYIDERSEQASRR